METWIQTQNGKKPGFESVDDRSYDVAKPYDSCLSASESQRVGTPEGAGAFIAGMINVGGRILVALFYTIAMAHWMSLSSWRPTTYI